MRLSVLAVGQMRGTDEAALYNVYAKRIAQAGRQIGLDGLHVHEIKDQSGANDKLLTHIAQNKHALVIALDETGENTTSRALSNKIANWRDDGKGEIMFIIGAANGLPEEIKKTANYKLSMGKLTWPHMLVRVLLAEQIYRAICILSGHPYHRD